MAAESSWKVWLAAARPRTLPAAVAPVIVGSALAWRAGAFVPVAAAVCLVFALLVQIGANYANDYYDFVRGADTGERVGPRRAVAAGLVTPAAMRRVMVLTFSLAFVVGLTLVAWGGWWLVLVGVVSIASAVAYTGGPFPLGYHGLGDLFVFVFFGLVAVGGTYYVQARGLSWVVLEAAAAVGLLTVNILVVNNYRDADTDRKAGKHTLVVRFGRGFALAQLAAAHAVACGIMVALAGQGLYSVPAAILVAAILGAYAYLQWRTLRRAREARELIALLGWCGAYLAAYSISLAVLIVTG
ncbi:MAG TPA: 1,4-dihydroxy-2-naphthoate polyprenyltransferase [Opitutaceae bacterium]|nr:1,4-dihydroxy-2-naphthoate polyprenyltransferase [Opitutaceae bacterium]